MPKKNFPSSKKQQAIDAIVGWKTPKFHQASECYVSLSAFDPERGKFRTKKFMLGHIKGKRNQQHYGDALIKRLTEKLIQGWNPWIEIVQPLEYSSFDDVCRKYEEYLLKLLRENNIREESVVAYMSRVKILKEWKASKKINLFYTYQFDNRMVGQLEKPH